MGLIPELVPTHRGVTWLRSRLGVAEGDIDGALAQFIDRVEHISRKYVVRLELPAEDIIRKAEASLEEGDEADGSRGGLTFNVSRYRLVVRSIVEHEGWTDFRLESKPSELCVYNAAYKQQVSFLCKAEVHWHEPGHQCAYRHTLDREIKMRPGGNERIFGHTRNFKGGYEEFLRTLPAGVKRPELVPSKVSTPQELTCIGGQSLGSVDAKVTIAFISLVLASSLAICRILAAENGSVGMNGR